MKAKLKTCTGWNGNSHEAYIYKNIDGNKYCRACASKLQPPKPINKVSKKQTFRITYKKTQLLEDKDFYMSVWKQKFFDDLPNEGEVMVLSPRCENCEKRLGEEPNLMFFHHILEKRNFPDFRHCMWNIAILCPDCHSGYESRPDLFPQIKEAREFYINKYIKPKE